MSLAVRVGDRHVTHLCEDLTFSWGLHGPASCSVQFRAPITRQMFPAFERVWVYDHKAETQYEGRLEDPGWSVDGDGQVWALSAVGESARASDRTAPLVYIDTDLSRWLREDLDFAISAAANVSEVPNQAGVDGLLQQFNPGQPIDTTSRIVQTYWMIQHAGMEVGGIEYTHIGGANFSDQRARCWTENPSAQLRDDPQSTTATSRWATIGDDIPSGATRIALTHSRATGGATNVGGDKVWVAFYAITIKAARLNLDGTLNMAQSAYQAGRNVYAHEVVTDLLARLLTGSYDVPNADVDTSSTFQINQLAYPDGITAAGLFEDLMGLQPDFYWKIGPANASGKATFTWRKWPTHVRYEASMGDGLDLPGNDAELFNEVVVRWKDRRERILADTYQAGTTIGGIVVPTVPALDDAGLTRTGYVDLGDEMGSQANADKSAAEFLLEHAVPPVAATLTVARRVYDHDLGRMVEPYEIRPGHLLRIRELGDSAADLAATGRDGKCVFRVTGVEYRHDTRAATVELDAPPKTDESTLAALVNRRERKR